MRILHSTNHKEIPRWLAGGVECKEYDPRDAMARIGGPLCSHKKSWKGGDGDILSRKSLFCGTKIQTEAPYSPVYQHFAWSWLLIIFTFLHRSPAINTHRHCDHILISSLTRSVSQKCKTWSRSFRKSKSVVPVVRNTNWRNCPNSMPKKYIFHQQRRTA